MKRWLAGILLVLAGSASAAEQVMTFRDPAQEQDFRQLTTQLRCPKCQNNSIADSNAMIATDLRQKVYQLMQEGQSKQQIIDYMVARYGNFVTYDPPLTPLTLLLWLLPLTALGAGAWVIFTRAQRRPSGPAVAVRAAPVLKPTGGEPQERQGPVWFFIPGAVVALVCCVFSYLSVGGYSQVMGWQQATAQAPALLSRVLDAGAAPLSGAELEQLALGLRTRLQQDSNNTEGWIMLGRIGMALGNASTATQAYARAYRLAPENGEAAMGYAEALTRSSDPEDNRHGGALLQQLVADGTINIRLLSLYAFYAFEQQHYHEAIKTWRRMLALLPPRDTRRDDIERSIAQARRQQAEK